MKRQFRQSEWDETLEMDLRELLALALREDLGQAGDLTTRALVPETVQGRAAVVARQAGIIAGLPAAALAAQLVDSQLVLTLEVDDGQPVRAGERVALLEGPAGRLLSAERLVLNLLGRLSGVASLTRRYVEAVAGTSARIYDTRKTTPGWRRLEKYAVRCGGGMNHRTGLYDAVLIKDNHLALGAESLAGRGRFTPAEAVRRARQFLADEGLTDTIVEVEVDTLAQLDEVLPLAPDIILLDNMGPGLLSEAVLRRDAAGVATELEASGGVHLATVAGIAATGIERISVGALTHSAVGLDLGLDWLPR